MAIERLRPTLSLDEERLHALKQVLPEAFGDGLINWEVLHELLGERIDDENAGTEHFGLFWPGKREARRLAAQPGKGALVPLLDDGVDEERTENIFIEGENLEVLKLLQKSYAGQIKMIYIDPPYNTGQDFIYKDNFTQPLEAYLKKTGQMGEEGDLLTTNTRASGRFHTNWLNMMYPRLRLARNLLNEYGVIFISIDDHEVHNLRQLMNEIFGEENFIGTFVWQSKKGGGSDSGSAVTDHEYVICFGASTERKRLSRISVEAEELDRSDSNGAYRRGRELNKWGSNSRREDRPTMFFPIPGPDGQDVYPIRNDGAEGCWRLGKTKMFEIVKRGDAEFVAREDGTFIVYEKIRTSDPRTKPFRTYLQGVGTTADGSKMVKDLFDGKKVFDFAKPVELVKKLISIGTSNETDIVLDFFAGSGTTAQAVMELNKEDIGSRRFICTQFPEPIAKEKEAYKAGFSTLSALCRERIRRAGKKVEKEIKNELGFDGQEHDLGFRSFSLQASNFKGWQDYHGDDLQELESLFSAFTTPLVDGWKEQDVMAEILLMEGFALNSKMGPAPNFASNKVMQVESEFSAHRLFICLDPHIHGNTIEQIRGLPDEDIFISLDSALTDISKVRLTDVSNVRTI